MARNIRSRPVIKQSGENGPACHRTDRNCPGPHAQLLRATESCRVSDRNDDWRLLLTLSKNLPSTILISSKTRVSVSSQRALIPPSLLYLPYCILRTIFSVDSFASPTPIRRATQPRIFRAAEVCQYQQMSEEWCLRYSMQQCLVSLVPSR